MVMGSCSRARARASASEQEKEDHHNATTKSNPDRLIITYQRKRKRRRLADPPQPCLDMVAYKPTFHQDQHDTTTTRHWSSWKDTLENLLQSPHIDEAGGIHACIRDALKHNSCQSIGQVTNGFIRSSYSSLQDNTDGRRADATDQPRVLQAHLTDPSVASGNGTSISLDANKSICNSVLLDILVSEKFALLCDLLRRNFHGNKSATIIDFHKIVAKMKDGEYGRSPQSFDRDIQQLWEKLEEVGREMMDLASSLSVMSRASYQTKACGISEVEVTELKTEEMSLVDVAGKVPKKDSITIMQLTPCISGVSTKPNPTEADGLYKICICKHCGERADGQGILNCTGCETKFHFKFIRPAVKIPTERWCCSTCTTKEKESDGDTSNHVLHDSLHSSCAVCVQLAIIKPAEHPNPGSIADLAGDTLGGSVSSIMEDEKKPDLSTTALSRLCKHCGTCEDDDKKFLICGHMDCPYKFYHIRCLKASQIASARQQNRTCWYCPSCLCRGCSIDKDDDQIVLCDGCDEAYHTYCMKPPRSSIPKGQWHCISCRVERTRQGMRRYEHLILKQYGSARHVSDVKDVKALLPDGPEK